MDSAIYRSRSPTCLRHQAIEGPRDGPRMVPSVVVAMPVSNAPLTHRDLPVGMDSLARPGGGRHRDPCPDRVHDCARVPRGSGLFAVPGAAHRTHRTPASRSEAACPLSRAACPGGIRRARRGSAPASCARTGRRHLRPCLIKRSLKRKFTHLVLREEPVGRSELSDNPWCTAVHLTACLGAPPHFRPCPPELGRWTGSIPGLPPPKAGPARGRHPRPCGCRR